MLFIIGTGAHYPGRKMGKKATRHTSLLNVDWSVFPRLSCCFCSHTVCTVPWPPLHPGAVYLLSLSVGMLVCLVLGPELQGPAKKRRGTEGKMSSSEAGLLPDRPSRGTKTQKRWIGRFLSHPFSLSNGRIGLKEEISRSVDLWFLFRGEREGRGEEE